MTVADFFYNCNKDGFQMKTLLLLFFSVSLSCVHAKDILSVRMRENKTLAIRTHWNDQKDLLLLCGPGWNNKQFNFSSTYLISKTQTMDSLMQRSSKLPKSFHWCGDSTGVMHMYSNAKRSELYILSGNHGFNGTTITLPGHKFTREDIGKKFKDKYYIVKINSKDSFTVVPQIRKKEVPEAKSIKFFPNFPGTRLLECKYTVDGKELPFNKTVSGKVFTVTEKTAICDFNALAAAKFQHDKVNDFYAVYEITYNFYPNSACRVDTRITFPQDIHLLGVSPMQDSDLEMNGFDFYEKYIPKVKPIQESAQTNWRKAQAYYCPQKKYMTDSRRYDFAAVQDLTVMRKTQGPAATRFQIKVNGGYVDPNDQPDRWIEFVGKIENGKRVRKIGNVLGLDTEHGIYRKSERARNNKSSFILPYWHKTYPTQFSKGKSVVKAGTVLESVGYRCYFNPEKIGDATVLFTIPVKDGKKIYADFHKSVKDYLLPFAANAQTVIMESSPGVSLTGNKVSVSGSYGYIVVKVK